MTTQKVTYRMRGGEYRFMQYAKDPLPSWAIDVQPHVEQDMTTQTAIGLADLLDSGWPSLSVQVEAAAMLRSQAVEIERLKVALGQPVPLSEWQKMEAEIERHRTNSDLQMQRAIRAEAEVELLKESNNRLTQENRNHAEAMDREIERLKEWQQLAFAAHPNIDLDIDAARAALGDK